MLIDLCEDKAKENIQNAHRNGGKMMKIGLGFEIIIMYDLLQIQISHKLLQKKKYTH